MVFSLPRIVILSVSEGSSTSPTLKILPAKALRMTKTKHFQKNVDLVHILSFSLKALLKMWTNMKWTYICFTSLPSDGAAATVERAKPSKITNELSDSRLGKILVSISFIGRGGRRDYLDHSMNQ